MSPLTYISKCGGKDSYLSSPFALSDRPTDRPTASGMTRTGKKEKLLVGVFEERQKGRARSSSQIVSRPIGSTYLQLYPLHGHQYLNHPFCRQQRQALAH